MSVSRILTDSQKDEETCTEQTKANQVQRNKINIIFDDRIIALQQACINDLQKMENYIQSFLLGLFQLSEQYWIKRLIIEKFNVYTQ
ncbi:hypothetical protein V1478_001680 [Vespula squamosa]|uniref:Uncharacterized protein n=1 Tax=Vespula squamosa TaxID=30214 RepID=A0ABD2BYE5_VESSQ